MNTTTDGAAARARQPLASERVLTLAHVLGLCSLLAGIAYVVASPWVLLAGLGSAMTAGGNPLSPLELIGWVVLPGAVAVAAILCALVAHARRHRFAPDHLAIMTGGWTARSLLLSVIGAVLMAGPWACMLVLVLRDGLR
ncbi:hypothetical protein [Demequina gelatinilytica]|uniref:hypothetical protein n=1 Tax=Demequina gelatinilytica TaxID=1638980 RepID=UPI00078367E1|nr:hypothetical protein [Demequina gelatinilytica]